MKSTQSTSIGDMPYAPQGPTTIHDYTRAKPSRGYNRYGKKLVKVSFGTELFEQIRKEAAERGWGVARMVRHLCEASIEGIE